MKAKPLNIMLADDDADDCLFFKDAIEEFTPSKKLTAVHNGEQLMQLLTNKTSHLPDILFLDLNMPRKNGFECLAELKKNKNLATLPVVIFSTSFDQEVVNLLYEKGANFFIRKPSQFSQFKQIILHTLDMLVQKNIAQPLKENFVLTTENAV